MRPATRGYVQVLEVGAPAEQVWRALVEREALVAWHADHAEVDARMGGRYSVRSRLFGLREAHIDLFEPGRHLRVIYDPAPGWPPIEESVIVEDFIIDQRGGRSVLRVIGSGVPDTRAWDPWLKRLQAGWAVAFAYLARRLEGPPA